MDSHTLNTGTMIYRFSPNWIIKYENEWGEIWDLWLGDNTSDNKTLLTILDNNSLHTQIIESSDNQDGGKKLLCKYNLDQDIFTTDSRPQVSVWGRNLSKQCFLPALTSDHGTLSGILALTLHPGHCAETTKKVRCDTGESGGKHSWGSGDNILSLL